MTGRHVSIPLALALAACASSEQRSGDGAPAPPPERTPERTNVLVVLTDDTRADWFGFEGHPFVETPCLDRLAAEGTRFTSSFVTTALCCPSRASLLTGLHAHAHGVTTNRGIDLDPALPTFPALLRSAGWRTAFIGKWHMGLGSRPRPGFDDWVSFDGQGTYFDPVLNEDGAERETAGYVTDLLTDRAVAWLEARPADEPFCLVVSHKATHTPMEPAPRHEDRYAERTIEPPVAAADDLAGRPEILRRGALFGISTMDVEEYAQEPIPERLPPKEWDMGPQVRRYLETLLAVDEGVGRLLDALERTGLDDRTVVVFTSDNGYVFGEHRGPDKRLAWEESIRVPLLVRLPGVPGGRSVDELALNIDLAPTVLELCGLDAPQSMQGASLVPLLRGEAVPWRDHFLYTYFRELRLEGLPTTLAIRTRDAKYVRYPESLPPDEELYDLTRDPHELESLAADPDAAERLAHLRDLLARARASTGFRFPEHARPSPVEPDEERVLLRLDGSAPVEDAYDLRLDQGSFRLRLALDGPAPSRGTLLAYGSTTNGFVLRMERGRPVLLLLSYGYLRRAEGRPWGTGATLELECGQGLDGRAYLDDGLGPPVRSPLSIRPARQAETTLRLGAGVAERLRELELVRTGSAAPVR